MPKNAAEAAVQHLPGQNFILNEGVIADASGTPPRAGAATQPGGRTWSVWAYDNISKPGYNACVHGGNTVVAMGELAANAGIDTTSYVAKGIFEKPPQYTHFQFGRVAVCDVPQPLTTADWWAQNLTTGVVTAVPYAVAAKASGAALRKAERSLELTGLSSKIAKSEVTASILGAAIYDYARDPVAGETRSFNALNGAATMAFFNSAHLLEKKSVGLIAQKFGTELAGATKAALQGAHQLGCRAATGATGAAMQTVCSGRNWTWNELGEASVHGAAMNMTLPYVQEGLTRGVIEPAKALMDWNYERRLIKHGLKEVQARHADEITARRGQTVYAQEGSSVRALEGSVVVALNGSTVEACRGSEVHAFDGSKVEALKGSHVTAFDGAVVTAGEGSHVVACKGSNVEGLGGSTIDARKDSLVYAVRETHVNAYEGSRVMASGQAHVDAFAGSSVFASNQATVTAHDGSTICAIDWYRHSKNLATIDARSGSTIYAHSKVAVTAHDGSIIYAQERCKLDAKEGATVHRCMGDEDGQRDGPSVIGFKTKEGEAKIEATKSIRIARAGERVIAEKGETINAEKGSTVEARAGSIVMASDGSRVYAHGGSSVEALAGSHVIAYESSSVKAREGSSVRAETGSRVEAFKGSSVEGREYALIKAYDGSSVDALASIVEAYAGSTVIANTHSEVTAHQGSLVKAMKDSKVNAKKDSHVEAYKGSFVRAGDYSNVDCYTGSRVQAIGPAKINAYEGCDVEASHGTAVEAFKGSYVCCGTRTTVNAHEGSYVRGLGEGTIQAYNGSRVSAGHNSQVYAHEGSHVSTEFHSYYTDFSTVHAFKGSKVEAKHKSITYAHEGAQILAAEGAIVEAGAGSMVDAAKGACIYARDGSVIQAQSGSTIWSEIGASVEVQPGAISYSCTPKTIDTLQQVLTSKGLGNLDRARVMALLPKQTYTGISAQDFVPELTSKSFSDDLILHSEKAKGNPSFVEEGHAKAIRNALAVSCTFGDQAHLWLADQAKLGRTAEKVSEFLPILPTEQLSDLRQWLTAHADRPLSEISPVAKNWLNFDDATRKLPYNRLIQAPLWQIDPGAVEFVDKSKCERPWQNLAANQAWNNIKEVRTQAEALPYDEGRSAIHQAFTNEFDQRLALGRDAVLRCGGNSELIVSAFHGNLDGPHAKALAASVDAVVHQQRQYRPERKFAVLQGLPSETFKKNYDRFGGELPDCGIDGMRRHINGSWQGQAALALTCTFGNEAERWLNLQRNVRQKHLDQAKASKDTTAIEQAESALSNCDHDATFWLPSAPATELQGLSAWLFRFGDPNNPANKGGGNQQIIRDPAELHMVASNWQTLTPEQRALPYKDLIATVRGKKYATQKCQVFATESASWGVSENEYAPLERRFLASLGTPSPFPLDKAWTSGNLTGRFLPRTDPRGLYLGLHTNCCQHPFNAGKSCAFYGQESPNSGFFVVENPAHEIVAQSWAWESDNGGLCFDSIEAKALGTRHTDVHTIYEAAAKDLSQKYHTVTVGSNHGIGKGWHTTNDAALKQPQDFSGYSSDSKAQWLLARNKNIPVVAKQQAQTSVRGARESDIEAAEKVARAVYPKGWQHVPDTADFGLVLVDQKKGVVGYTTIETEQQYISDLVVLPEFRHKSNLLMNSLFAYMRRVGGTWSADCRENTSYNLVKIAEKKGRIKIESDEVTHKMGDQNMHHVRFQIISPISAAETASQPSD